MWGQGESPVRASCEEDTVLTSRTARVSLETDPLPLIVHVALGKSDAVIWFLRLQRKRNKAELPYQGVV